MIIQVTQHDIDMGMRKSICFCPIACAIRKALICPRWISVSSTYLHFNGLTLLTPPEVAAFIRDFDNGKPVEPMAFTLAYEEKDSGK